jgi:serine/threonine protein kinase
MLRKKIGDFYLMSRIGSGSMADVYLGINAQTHEKRAFKILGRRATSWSSAYVRFLGEVDIIRTMPHPGIIRLLDNGIFEECYFFSMEYLPKGNLSRHMKHGKIPIDKALSLFLPICNAISYAHERGVIHRHLKPANILIRDNGKPVVSDFGISGVVDVEKKSISKDIMSAIAYLAPEQRSNGQKVNRRADVYALAAIFYEMIMGFPPLGNYPLPGEVLPDFPENMQKLLLKCLAIYPDERFESASLLMAELDKFEEYSVSRYVDVMPGGSFNELRQIEDIILPPHKTDRIEGWFSILRTGTTRERLAVVREMVEKITPAEAKTTVKLYAEEGDRVRWGLIRVLGELRIESAISLILSDLNSPFHTECAIDALGKIGSDKAYDAIHDYVLEHPDNIIMAMLPMAKTGKQRAIQFLREHLNNKTISIRQSAVKALASIEVIESLQALKEHLCIERDDTVRSDLFHAVHTLHALLLPSMKAPFPET